MVQAIRYAAEYAWTSRIDVGAEYAGMTGEDVADGKIIVRWDHSARVKMSAVLAESRDVTVHSADLAGSSAVLGYAQWTTLNADGSLVRAEIVLHSDKAPKEVDKCMMELLVHEFGHVYRLVDERHSERREDVMFAARGECRYSPSLSDLAMFNKPLKSCHVELTPHGDLEVLAFRGQRILLMSWSYDRWALGSIYTNPAPKDCSGVIVQPDRAIEAIVKSFLGGSQFLRLKQESGSFISIN